MRRMRNLTVTLCALVLTVAAPAMAADVNLDPTFSGDGKVFVNSAESTVLSLARDSGDIYFAGQQLAGRDQRQASAVRWSPQRQRGARRHLLW